MSKMDPLVLRVARLYSNQTQTTRELDRAHQHISNGGLTYTIVETVTDGDFFQLSLRTSVDSFGYAAETDTPLTPQLATWLAQALQSRASYFAEKKFETSLMTEELSIEKDGVEIQDGFARLKGNSGSILLRSIPLDQLQLLRPGQLLHPELSAKGLGLTGHFFQVHDPPRATPHRVLGTRSVVVRPKPALRVVRDPDVEEASLVRDNVDKPATKTHQVKFPSSFRIRSRLISRGPYAALA